MYIGECLVKLSVQDSLTKYTLEFARATNPYSYTKIMPANIDKGVFIKLAIMHMVW